MYLISNFPDQFIPNVLWKRCQHSIALLWVQNGVHRRVQDYLPESSTLWTQTGSSAPAREPPFSSREDSAVCFLFCFVFLTFCLQTRTPVCRGDSDLPSPSTNCLSLPTYTKNSSFPLTQTIFQELPCRLNVQLTMLHVWVLVIFLFIKFA